jgi:hypothetical protein
VSQLMAGERRLKSHQALTGSSKVLFLGMSGKVLYHDVFNLLICGVWLQTRHLPHSHRVEHTKCVRHASQISVAKALRVGGAIRAKTKKVLAHTKETVSCVGVSEKTGIGHNKPAATSSALSRIGKPSLMTI